MSDETVSPSNGPYGEADAEVVGDLELVGIRRRQVAELVRVDELAVEVEARAPAVAGAHLELVIRDDEHAAGESQAPVVRLLRAAETGRRVGGGAVEAGGMNGNSYPTRAESSFSCEKLMPAPSDTLPKR